MLAFPVRTGLTNDRGWALVGGFGMGPLPRWLSLSVIFALTAASLMAIAQETARTFARFAALDAYRFDILGSLTGILTLTGLSFLRLPPLAWGSLAALTLALLLGRPAADTSRCCRCRRRAAGGGVVRRVLPVVALLQDPGPRRLRRQRADRRQQHPAADLGERGRHPQGPPRSISTPTPMPARTTMSW